MNKTFCVIKFDFWSFSSTLAIRHKQIRSFWNWSSHCGKIFVIDT